MLKTVVSRGFYQLQIRLHLTSSHGELTKAILRFVDPRVLCSQAADTRTVSLGVRFLAVTQNFDTDQSNPMSRFLLHILAAFGELEREMIRERPNRPSQRQGQGEGARAA